MRCSCGSTRFVPLGVQATINRDKSVGPGKSINLINCEECGTTLSCSKHFYAVVKYLHNYHGIDSEIESAIKLAH